MTKDEYLTEDQVADILLIKKSTLQKNRSLGRNHPPYKKIGARVFYPRKEFDRWFNDQRLHKEIAG